MGKVLDFILGLNAPKKAAVAAEAISGGIIPSAAGSSLAGIVVEVPQFVRRESHLGMQGYAPIVAVSKNRKRCEGCGAPVRRGERHICIYNAQYYLDSLTAEERERLISELKALGVKSAAPVKRRRARRPK